MLGKISLLGGNSIWEGLLLGQIQVAIAVVAVCLLRLMLRRLPKFYFCVMWILVFARLLCPISLESRYSPMPSAREWVAMIENSGNTWDERSGTENPVREENHTGTVQTDTVNAVSNLSGKDSDHADFGLTDNAEYEDDFRNTQQRTWLPIGILTVWLLGVIGVLGYNGAAFARIRKRLKTAVHETGNIWVSKEIEAPFVAGCFRPKIYLPWFLEKEEREFILLHEQVHIRRKDYLVKKIAFLLLALNWYQPFVWLAFFCLGWDMEMSCDEAVMRKLGDGIKKPYSQSLLNFAKGRETLPVTPVHFGENGVKSRIGNVLSYKKTRKWVYGAGIVIVAVVVAALFTVRGRKNTADWTQEEATALLEQWAQAFAGRNGDALFELSQDKENFEAWDLVYPLAEGGYAFGSSSPWPFHEDYEIFYTEGEPEAVIRYVMWNSAPEFYMARETLEIVQERENLLLNHKELTEYDPIETKEQYLTAYMEASGEGYVFDDFAGYIAGDIGRHLEKQTNPEYYTRYQEPLSAAVAYLHLGEGSAEVVYEDESQTRAVVKYTFAEDGQTIEIPMKLTIPLQGVWRLNGSRDLADTESQTEPAGTDSQNAGEGESLQGTESGRSESEELEEVLEELTADGAVYQATGSGIYRVTEKGRECLYPMFAGVSPNMQLYEGKLYFMTDLSYYEGALEWENSGICWIDLDTGESGTIEFDDVSGMTHFDIEGGFVTIYSGTASEPREYLLPDLGSLVYRDKTLSELSDEDKQEWGLENSRRLLDNPGELLHISAHTGQESQAFLDMDLDGSTEKIVLGAYDGKFEGMYGIIDHFALQIGEDSLEDYGENLLNEIWAISLDGEHIHLVLYEDGPSGDPYTYFYNYENGKIVEAGSFDTDIRRCEITENGVIQGITRSRVLQTDGVRVKWHRNEQGRIVQIQEDFYEFTDLGEVELLEDLPLHPAPNEEEVFTLSPQTVQFLQVSGDWQWVMVQAESGDKGWMKMEDYGTVSELGKYASDVFAGLNNAG